MKNRSIFRFCRNQDGNVMMIVALGIVALLLAGGLAMDTSRSHLMRAKMQADADSTALAVGAELNAGMLDPANINTRAQALFNASFKQDYLDVQPPAVSASQNGTTGTVTVTATAQLPTMLMKLAGQDQVTLTVSSNVLHNLAVPTEIVLALDVTGSMALPLTGTESKYIGLYKAASSFMHQLSIVNTENATNEVYVGIVPYTQTVNIGVTGVLSVPSGISSFTPPAWNTDNSWLDANDPSLHYDWADSVNTTAYSLIGDVPYTTPLNHIGSLIPYGWAGCVMARPSATASTTTPTLTLDISDDPPSVSKFQRFYYPNDNDLSQSTVSGNNCAECTNYSSSGSGTGTVGEGGTVTIGGTCQSSYVGNNPWSCQLSADTGPVYFIDDSFSNNTSHTFDEGSMWWIPSLSGPNYACPQIQNMSGGTWPQPFSILPFQPAQSGNLTGMLQELLYLDGNPALSNGTTIDIGLAWAWRLISPHWTGLWKDAIDDPAVNWRAVPPHNLHKYIVLMTDGINNTTSSNTTNGIFGNHSYTAYGLTAPDGVNFGINPTHPVTSVSGIIPTTANLDAKTLQLCSAIKAANITIYTIGFGTSTDVNTALLSACASPGDYVLATDNAGLTAAFNKIADDILKNLRVTK